MLYYCIVLQTANLGDGHVFVFARIKQLDLNSILKYANFLKELVQKQCAVLFIRKLRARSIKVVCC